MLYIFNFLLGFIIFYKQKDKKNIINFLIIFYALFLAFNTEILNIPIISIISGFLVIFLIIIMFNKKNNNNYRYKSWNFMLVCSYLFFLFFLFYSSLIQVGKNVSYNALINILVNLILSVLLILYMKYDNKLIKYIGVGLFLSGFLTSILVIFSILPDFTTVDHINKVLFLKNYEKDLGVAGHQGLILNGFFGTLILKKEFFYNKRIFFIFNIILIMQIFSLVFLGSRSIIIFIAIYFIIIFLKQSLKYKIAIFYILILTFFIFSPSIIELKLFQDYLYSFSDNSSSSDILIKFFGSTRVESYRLAFIYLEPQYLGYGLGYTNKILRQYLDYGMHNYFIQMFFDSGYFGLISLISLYISLILGFIISIIKNNIFIAAVILFLIINFFVSSFPLEVLTTYLVIVIYMSVYENNNYRRKYIDK
jgi:hypothetical protein